ncbi:hypothetical protein [Alloactinosynnema sp. L-07]|uniref:hypothetical protein n=1 Tax=Alloactinosynnema sp. L-07 TaxID=1653480 RepID=UPI00065F02C4|nr:hypothetical protein [Alloactinosynnema sp. L-07]CRK55356.1 hypothetical protein [Alloactinosynnema sp. L-07]
MTWSETNSYYSTLRSVAADLERTRDGVVPWRPGFAEIFGDREGLLLALRRRWVVMVQAQVEWPVDRNGRPSAELRALAAQHPGLLATLGGVVHLPVGA